MFRSWLVKSFTSLGRQPGRTKPHVNLGRRQVCRLHRLQRLDVLGEARISQGGGVRDRQLLANVAGEILVVSLPFVRLRIAENEPLQVGQEFFDRLVQQARHVVEVNAAALIQASRATLPWACRRIPPAAGGGSSVRVKMVAFVARFVSSL